MLTERHLDTGPTPEQLFASYSVAEKKVRDDDRHVMVPEFNVFAVFDGISKDDGSYAADVASEFVGSYHFKDTYDASTTESNLIECLDYIDMTIKDNASMGFGPTSSGTTAVLARIIEDNNGQKWLCGASAGDSRLYLYSPKSGCFKQLTTDESRADVLQNWLGSGSECSEFQSFSQAISEGDMIVLVTDGVTGDYHDDTIAEQAITDIVLSSQPGEEAQNLVDLATKDDDRTAIVINI